MSQVPAAATKPATTGARTAGMTTLLRTPLQATPLIPRDAIAAPISPPNSACEELEGMPSNHVARFQMMPPTRPAKTMVSSAWPPTFPRFTTPLATVAATSTERKAPTRFKEADRATATLGLRAPVAIDVAIALPVS